ncbi:hypothetical protein RKD28_000217, partial [Streptomyces sp. SAI-229]
PAERVPHRCAMGKRTPALRARERAGGTLRVPLTDPAAQGW